MEPTAQQVGMANACKDKTSIIGSARAGTGKSTTLAYIASELADIVPGISGCVAVYNKAAALDMGPKLPRGFEARTTHSLAYRENGIRYDARINPKRSGHRALAPWDLGRHMGLPGKISVTTNAGTATIPANTIAGCVLRTIKNYCSSASPDIEARHVSLPDLATRESNPKLVNTILNAARMLWTTDCTNPRGVAPYSPDWYLKEWGNRVIAEKRGLGFDCFWIDEGQDSTSLIKEIFKIQLERGVHGIVVGDPYQAIYGWRGARDIMTELVEAGMDEHILSQSFRFGPAVADEGCKWLQLAGGKPDLEGSTWIDSRLGPVDESEPYAILCRTNAGCAAEILNAYDANLKVGAFGNLANVINLLKAALRLRGGKTVDHPLLAVFPSWYDLTEYVGSELCDEQELKLVVQLMNGGDASRVVTALEAAKHVTNPHVTVATAHATKGMQWNQVKIGRDWKRPKINEDGTITIPRDLARLGYVAVTRAQTMLDVGGNDTGLGWVNEYV